MNINIPKISAKGKGKNTLFILNLYIIYVFTYVYAHRNFSKEVTLKVKPCLRIKKLNLDFGAPQKEERKATKGYMDIIRMARRR